MTKMAKALVAHPFLFAIYPVLFLFSQNIAQVSFNELLVPTIIALGIAVTTFLLTVLVFKDAEKAGIITSIFLILFFSYGHVFRILNRVGIGNSVYLLLIDGVIIAFGFYFLRKAHRNLNHITNLLNLIASCLIIFSLFTVGVFVFKTRPFRPYPHNVTTTNMENNAVPGIKPSKLPNIYYIILDAYAREDVLSKIFNFNNDKFIDYLIRKGFYVANRSLANYSFTQLSLASSLNYGYLDTLAKSMGVENTDYNPIFGIIWYNRALGFLKNFGYKSKVIHTAGTGLLRCDVTDVYRLKKNQIWLASAFQYMVLNSTPLPHIFRYIPGKAFDEFDFHRKQVLYAFDTIVDLSKEKGPFFLFAHIIKPHLPFVFDERGNPIAPHRQYGIWYTVQEGLERNEYIELYKKQLSFINKKVAVMIDEILSNSSESPIIILQSDHGPTLGSGESLAKADIKILFPILNAYYLPNGGKKYLYPTISPVNTFRVIFNHYFHADLKLLPDRGYYAQLKYPYRYFNVTEQLREEN